MNYLAPTEIQSNWFIIADSLKWVNNLAGSITLQFWYTRFLASIAKYVTLLDLHV